MLKARKPSVKVIAVESRASPQLTGGQLAAHKIKGSGWDSSPEVARLIAHVEGIPGGISTGANIAVRDDMARKTIVTFVPFSAERYLSTELFLPEGA